MTVLCALVLAPASLVSQPAIAGPAAQSAPSDIERGTYCIDPSIQNMYPTCAPPPAPTADYVGEPVAVHEKKKVNPGTVKIPVNVLKNDAIEKRAKVKKVKITYQRPAQTGVRAWVDAKKRIVYEAYAGGPLPVVYVAITYKVVDFKGRSSQPVNTYLEVNYRACAYTNTCTS